MVADAWVIETVEECITLLNSEKFKEIMVWDFMLDKQGRTHDRYLGSRDMLQENAGKDGLVTDKTDENLKGGSSRGEENGRRNCRGTLGSQLIASECCWQILCSLR